MDNNTKKMEEKIQEISELYKNLLTKINEDPEREGLLKTPQRAAKAMEFLTQGYEQNPHQVLESAIFHQEHKDIVLVENIDFFSLCEHHLLPFFGKAHVAYIPDGKIVGLSKIPRLVDIFARRLQVQERMTQQILEVLQEVLQPLGVAVQLQAHHLCMQMRGVQKANSYTKTQAFSGIFEKNLEYQKKFISLLSN